MEYVSEGQQIGRGIGELLWDVLSEGKLTGGAPANFAYHVSQFGIPSCVNSAVGNDKLGDELVNQFADKPVETEIERVGYRTGTVDIELDNLGIPTYDIKQNVAWDNIPFTDRLNEWAKRTMAVSFGSLKQRSKVTRETIHRFLDSMPAEDNQLKIFDINLRQGFFTQEIIEESMRRCNMLKINDEELVAVSRMLGVPGTDLQDKCWILLGKFDLDILVLTCGVNGNYVITPDKVSFVDTPKVTVADTVGAGDSFTASFTAALLSGKRVREAHELAVKVSAYVCTQHGAMPRLPKELITV